MIRFLTAGESHGKAEVAILEGLPAGIPVNKKEIQKELDKRRGGSGRGGRGIIEDDHIDILSGVRFGKTLGSPIALLVRNNDFANWEDVMSPDDQSREIKEKKKVTSPRPGHADLAGVIKYGFDDARNVLERSSARETVMRTAVGAICKIFLVQFGIEVASHTIQIGSVRVKKSRYPFKKVQNASMTDPQTRCVEKGTREKMQEEILTAIKGKDTLGGIVEVIAHHVPVGLGSHVHFDRKLDGRLAGALMSIPSVKAVEIGDGMANVSKRGSLVHDEIIFSKGNYSRKTNRAGGIEGGISNGEDIICRVFHKPVSTLGNPLQTVDIETKRGVSATMERSDICIVPRAGIIAESMVAFVLADVFMEKFGGDSLTETHMNFENYLTCLK